jgi:hypothetical protein
VVAAVETERGRVESRVRTDAVGRRSHQLEFFVIRGLRCVVTVTNDRRRPESTRICIISAF